MALLIVNLDKVIGNAQAWRDTFREQLPDLAVRFWPNAGELADIEYLAFMHPDFDKLPTFPNLKAVFSRAAGVDDIVKHPKLPKVRVNGLHPLKLVIAQVVATLVPAGACLGVDIAKTRPV